MAASTITASNEIEQAKSGISTAPIQIQASAVSWGAIVAGAAAIATLSLILLILGTGLGLSSVSPWTYSGVSATAFGVSTILWLTFTQLFASGIGGYLAGRLRTKWIAVHTDEVYFRDTAHGFLAWAVAALTSAVILTSVIGSLINSGIQAGATVAGGVATTATVATTGIATTAGSGIVSSSIDNNSMDYLIDSLFRKNLSANTDDATQDVDTTLSETSALEVTRIFINSIQMQSLPEEDMRYVGQLVAKHSNLTQHDAEKRVTDTFAYIQEKLQAAESATKEATDQARKASAYASLWLFISLLAGAFVASFAATYGGRQRDM